jgi:hypothetical protein
MTGLQMGSWASRIAHGGVSIDWEVAAALDDELVSLGLDDEVSQDTVDAVCAAYRAAINAALPPGVTLAGNEFYGTVEADDYQGYPTDEDGRLDLNEIVASVDFWAIAEPLLAASPATDANVAQEATQGQ